MFYTYYLRFNREDPPLFVLLGMVTGRRCSWHTGRNKLKLGSEIQNPLLSSREQALQGEKAKLPNNGCTCCKFISPSSSSPLPATKNRKLRSEECVPHWRHITWFLHDEVLLLFKTSNSYLPLFRLGDSGAKMPGAPLNSRAVCKKLFQITCMCNCSQANSLATASFLLRFFSILFFKHMFYILCFWLHFVYY